jgi:hypothetical protein
MTEQAHTRQSAVIASGMVLAGLRARVEAAGSQAPEGRVAQALS